MSRSLLQHINYKGYLYVFKYKHVLRKYWHAHGIVQHVRFKINNKLVLALNHFFIS